LNNKVLKTTILGIALVTILIAFLFRGFYLESLADNKVINPDIYEYEFPEWVKGIAGFWAEGMVDDKTYLASPQSGNAHTCKPKQTEADKYWCFACGDGGAAIPKINPCIHRRPDEVRALYEKEKRKNDPQKRIFESDDD